MEVRSRAAANSGIHTRSYASVAAILRNRQDARPAAPEPSGLLHENIRGPAYYH